jgi:hypothetical protein
MSQLKQGIVIDVPAWKVPVICRKKYLTQPEIAVSVKVGADDIKGMPDKQYKAFDASFEKQFTPQFQKMSNGWFADMQKTIDTTENAIEGLKKDKKGTPESRKKFITDLVTKANQGLMAKCKMWTDMVAKLAQKAYEAAFEAALKAMQMKVIKAKAKMIAKVALFVALTLTAAAVTIALSVVSLGAGAALAPVVIAGIMTAGKALLGSGSEILKSYDVLQSTIASVEAAAKKLQASTAASIKAMQITAGKLDKASAAYKMLSADTGALDKSVGQLDKFIAVANASTKKNLLELQKLADQLAAAKDKPQADKLEKQALEIKKSFNEAAENLGAIAEIKKTAQEAKDAFNKLDPGAINKALGKLAPLVTKVKAAKALISKYAPMLKTIVSGSIDITKAVSKAS